MPKTMVQGQGDTTSDKQRGIGAAFKFNLNVFQTKFGDWKNARYFHFDLNCGSGYNDQADCIGSPLAFLQAAEHVGCERFFAGFIDNNPGALKELFSRPELHDSRCFPFDGDNASLIPVIPRIITHLGERPEFSIGTVLSDPNGSGVPIDEMAWLSKRCPRLDFVVNWNSTQFKRNRAAFGDNYPTLMEAIEKLNKQHWLIREPVGRYQWTLLIGRNVMVGDYKSLGFYRLESPKGQAIFNRCNYTAVEQIGLSGQLELFGNEVRSLQPQL